MCHRACLSQKLEKSRESLRQSKESGLWDDGNENVNQNDGGGSV